MRGRRSRQRNPTEHRPERVVGSLGVCTGAETRRQRSPTSGMGNRGGAYSNLGSRRPLGSRAEESERERDQATEKWCRRGGSEALPFPWFSPRTWDLAVPPSPGVPPHQGVTPDTPTRTLKRSSSLAGPARRCRAPSPAPRRREPVPRAPRGPAPRRVCLVCCPHVRVCRSLSD